MVKQSETSGSATAAGWLPNHLTVWRERSLIAAAPLYVKVIAAVNLCLITSGLIWLNAWECSITQNC